MLSHGKFSPVWALPLTLLACVPEQLETKLSEGLSVAVVLDPVGRPLRATADPRAAVLGSDERFIIFSLGEVDPPVSPGEVRARLRSEDAPGPTCGVCSWISTGPPMLLMPGDTCPMPAFASTQLGEFGDLEDIRLEVELDRAGPCPSLPAPGPVSETFELIAPERDGARPSFFSISSEGDLLAVFDGTVLVISTAGERVEHPLLGVPIWTAAVGPSSFLVLNEVLPRVETVNVRALAAPSLPCCMVSEIAVLPGARNCREGRLLNWADNHAKLRFDPSLFIDRSELLLICPITTSQF